MIHRALPFLALMLSPARAAEPLPHAFLLPRGTPPPPGAYAVQLTPFLQSEAGRSKLDLGAHASVGMFERGGLHLRSLGIGTFPTTELIGMASLVRDGGRGLSLLAIAGAPTGPSTGGHHGSWSFLAGLAGHWPGRRWGADAVLHYDFTASHLLPEAALVLALGDRLFAVAEGSATLGDRAELYALPGLKLALGRSVRLGAGYRFPLTRARKFDGQALIQVELGGH